MDKEYSNAQDVQVLIENISKTKADLLKINDWVQEIRNYLTSSSGDLVIKIRNHIDLTGDLVNTIYNKLTTAETQIETNAANCDKVWNSCEVGKVNIGLMKSKEIIARNKLDNGIELTIKEIIDVGYWSGSERTKTTTKTISEEDMVNGREFNF